MVPSLHLYFWKIFSASLQVILTDSCSVNSCSLVCLWEGCEPRVPPTPLSRLLQSVLALFNQVDVRVPCLTEQVRRGESTACIIWKRMKRNVLICSSVQMLFSQYILQEWFGFLEKIQQLAFPGSSAGKESTCNAGDPNLISGSGRSPGEEIGYPLKNSWASLLALSIKNPPATWESWVRSLVGRSPGGGHSNPL